MTIGADTRPSMKAMAHPALVGVPAMMPELEEEES
jgi:hypothetical protein